jgi:hypothetical protein
LVAEERKLAKLLYGVMYRPEKYVAPFRLPGIRLDASDSTEMEKVIEKRLLGCIWREFSPEESRKQSIVSREFTTRNAYGSARSVADLSHLSYHYKSILTKAETLEGIYVSLCWLCRPTDQDSNVESKECLAFFRMLVF